jgi:hypothetical protein
LFNQKFAKSKGQIAELSMLPSPTFWQIFFAMKKIWLQGKATKDIAPKIFEICKRKNWKVS